MAEVEEKRPVKAEAQAIAEAVSRALKSTAANTSGVFRMTEGQRASLRKSLRRAR